MRSNTHALHLTHRPTERMQVALHQPLAVTVDRLEKR